MKNNQTTQDTKSYPVLSIDAWGNLQDGYEWNNWYKVGTFEGNSKNEEAMRACLLSYIKEDCRDKVAFYDDWYNYVCMNAKTEEPLFAIEYGSVDI